MRGARCSLSAISPPVCTTSIVEKLVCPFGFGVSRTIVSSRIAPGEHWWYLADAGLRVLPVGTVAYGTLHGAQLPLFCGMRAARALRVAACRGLLRL